MPTTSEIAPVSPSPLSAADKALRMWGPKGRIVARGTGEPVPWKAVFIQVRRRGTEGKLEVRGEDRGSTPAGDAETLSAFDLSKPGGVERRDVFPRLDPPRDLEYRIVAQAWGYVKGATEWKPLPEGPGAGDVTVDLERDELSTLLATVRHADGRPFHGSVIASVRDRDVDFGGAGSGSTDDAGRSRIPGLPSGDHEVRLQARAESAAGTWEMEVLSDFRRVILPAGGVAEAEFVIPVTGEIAITWCDEGGTPLRGSNILVQYGAQSRSYSNHVERVTGLTTGSVTLTLQARGFREWKSTVQVVAGAVTAVEARMKAE